MKNDVKKFYSAFADEYDNITSFNERLTSQKSIIEKIIEKYNIKEALDAGCGTGLYSILLARAGVKVTAVDISREMIYKLKKNAKRFNLNIDTIVCDLINVDKKLSKKFDAIFCLGNTIPHILQASELIKVYKSFYNLLKTDGVLLIQQLNYDKILKYKENVRNVKKTAKSIYIRFYDYDNGLINFFMMFINLTDTKDVLVEKLILKPYKVAEQKEILNKAGFNKIFLKSDLELEDSYKKHKSNDLIIIAVKKNESSAGKSDSKFREIRNYTN